MPCQIISDDIRCYYELSVTSNELIETKIHIFHRKKKIKSDIFQLTSEKTFISKPAVQILAAAGISSKARTQFHSLNQTEGLRPGKNPRAANCQTVEAAVLRSLSYGGNALINALGDGLCPC